MIGLLVEILLSWLLLHYVAKQPITVLGFKPTAPRIRDFLAGFVLAGFGCACYHYMSTAFAGNYWIMNKTFTFSLFMAGLWFTIKSVLFEEFIFRGALLYIAIQKIGAAKACLLSACCFGIFHWFNIGVWGNPFQMTILFLMTGLFGWVMAKAFAQTKSMLLPIALHAGWNILNIVVFSNGPLGKQMLLRANDNMLEDTTSLFVFLFQVFAVPLLALLYLKWIATKKREPAHKEIPV